MAYNIISFLNVRLKIEAGFYFSPLYIRSLRKII